MRRLSCLRPIVLSTVLAAVTVGYSPFLFAARSSPDSPYRYAAEQSGLRRTESPQAYIVEARPQGTLCRSASREEADSMARRVPDPTLHVITPLHRGLRPEAGPGGLQIILRGTGQLDQFPAAKAAFLKAAANWEAMITTPISIVIDVDFGPSGFGTAFPKDVLGSTDPQLVEGSSLVTPVRDFLIGNASTQSDLDLYNALPSSSVPTDLGSTSRVNGPTAAFRASGLLPSVADPTGEQANFGPPPQVAFNSKFQFTFDPSGGIAANTFDFDAVATHEIGHVLGFHSSVGETELTQPPPLSVSVFDIWRFRPGMTAATLGSSNRIESSGGTQDFFFGAPELALSTGRPDGTGGDGQQASHWKDASATGTPIGIMIPAIGPGERVTISSNDLKAFESIGYTTQSLDTSGSASLSSGVASQGQVSMPPAGSCNLGGTQYMIQVPNGATQLTVDVTGDQAQTDLLVRYGRPVTIVENAPVDDYQSPTTKASQEIIVSGSSSPPIAPGTYFIAIGNCASAALNFTLTATVVGGSTGGGGSTVITALSGSLQGNTLTLTGVATNPNGNIAQADVTFFDGAGHTAGDTGLFSSNFGTSTTSNFTLTVNNMQNFASAVKASLVLSDAQGGKSAAFVSDFSQADPGGPQITTASFDPSGLMTVRGNGFATPIQLESNGTIVNVRIKIKGGGGKLKIPASASDLNLVSGANRIKIFVNGLRSNIFVLIN